MGGQGLLVGDCACGVAGGQGCGLHRRLSCRRGSRCACTLAGVDALGQQHRRHRVRRILGQQAAELHHIPLQGDGLPPGLPGQLHSRPAFGGEQHGVPRFPGSDRIAQPGQSQTEQEQKQGNAHRRTGGQRDFHLHSEFPYWLTMRTRLSTERRRVSAGVIPKKALSAPSPARYKRWAVGS